MGSHRRSYFGSSRRFIRFLTSSHYLFCVLFCICRCMEPFARISSQIHERVVLDDESSKKRLYCQHLQHTLQSLIELCPLGSNAGLQLIEDYVMQVKQQPQPIFFDDEVPFQAFAFVGGKHRLFPSCPSSDAFVIAAVSKRFQFHIQAHFSELCTQRTVASSKFPKLASWEASFGKPEEFLPVPTWHQWKLDAWAKLNPRWQDENCPWHYSGPLYHRDVSKLVSLWHSENSTAGFYQYVRFQFSSWEFDAETETWEEEDHL